MTNATSLNDLLSNIRRGDIDLSDNLPTFGGEEPANTLGVWSWDETSLLVGTCVSDLEIEDRD
jgi:hypothetical protein